MYSTRDGNQFHVPAGIEPGACVRVSHLPVTLLEPACGDVSIFPELYIRRGKRNNALFKKASRSKGKQGLSPNDGAQSITFKRTIAMVPGETLESVDVWWFSAWMSRNA